jgi:hypothetical protein
LEETAANAIIGKLTIQSKLIEGENIMKQKLGFILGILVLGILVAISLIHDSKANAAQSPEKAIKNTVQHYLDAVNTGDIDTMVKYTDDLRFPDKSVQKTNYKGIKESVTDISIQSVEPLSPTSYKVNVTATIKGNKQQFALPLVNKYGMWLVVIGQQQQQ